MEIPETNGHSLSIFVQYEGVSRVLSRIPVGKEGRNYRKGNSGKRPQNDDSTAFERHDFFESKDYRDHTPSTPPPLSFTRLMIAGSLAGVIGWAATFGFDVVKTRMQGVRRDEAGPYRTTVGAIYHCWRTEGYRVFFRGLSPTLIR